MEPMTMAVIGIIVMVSLVLVGMDVGTSMFAVGLVGYFAVTGNFHKALNLFQTVPFTTALTYSLTVIPLFVLMGEMTLQSGMSKGLYDACERLLGRFPGGLCLATLVSCGGFGAICGSCPAAVATIGKLSLPEMRQYRYKDGFSAATIAAGGTLSWLIPPSTGFILFGIIASVSVGRLFASGIVPGVILLLAFMVACAVVCRKDPALAPRGGSYTAAQRLKGLLGLLPVACLFVVIIGGMFSGLFSATEAAAVGAAITIVYTVCVRRFTLRSFGERLASSVKTSLMAFQIMMGAYVFGYFLTITRLPQTLASYIAESDVNPKVVMLFIFIMYVVVGMFMDALSTVLITVPIFMPVVMGLGYDPVWFGCVIVLLMVLGAISPPIGINLFVSAGLDKKLMLPDIYRNVVPYCVALAAVTLLVMFFPQLALALPNAIYGVDAGA